MLKPGGRIAVLTTCARGPAPVRRAEVAASRLAPLRLFDADDVTDAMRDAGLVDVTRERVGALADRQCLEARRQLSRRPTPTIDVDPKFCNAPPASRAQLM